MFKWGEGEMLTRQDRAILESAETLLRMDRPDCFDLNILAQVSGIGRKTIQDRFPFPELLTLGIVVMVWEEKVNHRSETLGYSLNRPNGIKLKTSDWEPDPELLNHFADHPIVRIYHEGEPPLRLWFKKSGKVS